MKKFFLSFSRLMLNKFLWGHTRKQEAGKQHTHELEGGKRQAKKRGKKLHIFKFYLRAEQKKNFHLFSSAICGKICARRRKVLRSPDSTFQRNSPSYVILLLVPALSRRDNEN